MGTAVVVCDAKYFTWLSCLLCTMTVNYTLSITAYAAALAFNHDAAMSRKVLKR
jgi:hypothetical protein